MLCTFLAVLWALDTDSIERAESSWAVLYIDTCSLGDKLVVVVSGNDSFSVQKVVPDQLTNRTHCTVLVAVSMTAEVTSRVACLTEWSVIVGGVVSSVEVTGWTFDEAGVGAQQVESKLTQAAAGGIFTVMA